MISDAIKQCKKNECNNIVLSGKYCEHCKQIRKEHRENVLKIAAGAAATVGSIALAVIFKKPPNISGK